MVLVHKEDLKMTQNYKSKIYKTPCKNHGFGTMSLAVRELLGSIWEPLGGPWGSLGGLGALWGAPGLSWAFLEAQEGAT